MLARFRSKVKFLSLPAALLLLAGLASPLHAAVQDRIQASIASGEAVGLPATVAPRARLAADLGAADPKLVLNDMTLSFSLTAAQQAALTELLLEQQQPSSANYHKWLTPEQFADQFGLSTGDIAKVSAWLSSQGFTITSIPRSRNFISFTGTAAQVQQTFGTTIHNLSIDGEKHFGNLTDPTLPAPIAAVSVALSGLNDFKLVSRVKSRVVPAPATDAVHPDFTSSISGNHYIAPADFYTIYDVNPLLTNNINGTGIKIAVMGQTDISLSDVAAFRAASGLSTNVPTVQLYGTDPGTSTNDLTEAQLDVEWSGAAAPSASIIYVNSTNVVDTSLRQAIANNLAPIITISYGNCESAYGTASLNSFNLLFQQANAQGITIAGPAGDSGAADCDYQVASATQGLAVDFPASSPYVTSVGGTMYNEGSGNYWATTNAAAYNGSGSALSYIPETVWNESSSSGLAAGGGGVSAYFTKPAWQVGTGVPTDYSRDVPDLSLNAAASHDGYLVCSAGSCTNGYRNASNNLNVVGGTSVSTPNFAGLLALVLQKNGASTTVTTNTNHGLGNVNPTLYALANSTFYTAVYHDVTTGTNAVPCTTGSTGCPAGGSIGYSAGIGYDLATGWGSVDAYNLVNDWSLVVPLGITGGQNLSTTTLTTTTANVTQGTAINFTATVASGSTTATSTPTGTVQLLVDGTTSGSPVALVSGTATLTLATTSLTSGTHTVSAVYSGDTTYSGSKGSVSIDITSAAAADFSISGSATTITVASGGTAPAVTYTLTSLNGFAGSITMSGSAASSLNASAAFSVSPVTLTASGTGTTVFTLYAYVTNTGSTAAAPLASNRKPTWMLASGGMAFASMLLILIPGRLRRRLTRSAGIFSMLLLAVAAIGISGCGGSSGVASVGGTKTNATPGTYQITITGTSGALSHSTTLTLIVQ